MNKLLFLSFILRLMTEFAKKNAVKLGVMSIHLDDLSINYERSLNEKKT